MAITVIGQIKYQLITDLYVCTDGEEGLTGGWGGDGEEVGGGW